MAGLSIRASSNESAWDSVAWLADLGILATPGVFYGDAGAQHIRIAMTATDEQIASAAARLQAKVNG